MKKMVIIVEHKLFKCWGEIQFVQTKFELIDDKIDGNCRFGLNEKLYTQEEPSPPNKLVPLKPLHL